jgi:hypothetical protein
MESLGTAVEVSATAMLPALDHVAFMPGGNCIIDGGMSL